MNTIKIPSPSKKILFDDETRTHAFREANRGYQGFPVSVQSVFELREKSYTSNCIVLSVVWGFGYPIGGKRYIDDPSVDKNKCNKFTYKFACCKVELRCEGRFDSFLNNDRKSSEGKKT